MLGFDCTDIRDQLPQRPWRIGARASTTSLTWHYNGPAVAPEHQYGPGLLSQLAGDAAWQMRAGWGGTKDGAPHLMYHLVIASDGKVYQTSDMAEVLWHCAHQDGNSAGLALHFPIGEGQQPSTAQMISAIRVSEALRARYGIPLNRVLGHLEWKHATACPGAILMARLLEYRNDLAPRVVDTPTPAGLRRFQLAVTANVRQGPGTNWKVAGTLKQGTILFIDVEKADGWLHLARVPNEQADLGFVSSTLGEWL
jgi:hypothetical protein